MKNKFSIIYLFIVVFHFKLNFCFLIFPFKTYQSIIENSDKNLTLLLRSLIDNHIFINLEIGNPKQIIKVFLRSNTNNFYLSEKRNNTKSQVNDSNPLIFNINVTNFFDWKNSSSLEITNKSIYSSPGDIHLGNVSNDYFYFIDNFGEKTKIRIPFILYHSIMGNMPGVIGLKSVLYEIHKEYNFIYKLRLNEIINSFCWMINYTSDYEGNLILGEMPHGVDPINFMKNELYYSHPFADESTYDWGLRFDKITFNAKKINNRYPCLFNYEYNYVQGIDDLEKELDNYFNESILNGICYKETIKYPYAPHKFFYCDKEKYKDKIKYFPIIKFYHNELNYTFKLNYLDLFIEKQDKLILLIFFDEYTIEWYLGKPFLKKYSFVMNQDSKLLGFYHNNKPKYNNESNNKINYIIFKIILIILGIIFLFILGIFIGKNLNKNNVKHKNVIDEDYEYISKTDEIN